MLTTAARIILKDTRLVIRALVADPLDAWAALRDHVEREQDIRRGRAFDGVPAADLYPVDSDWEPRLHSMLGCPWPCPATAEFWTIFPLVMKQLEAKGIRVGPDNFKGNNDGDAGLVRAIWCLVRHLHPRTVVETGVAHGVTSRLILEALARNDEDREAQRSEPSISGESEGGRLWSIDRPPIEPELQAEVGLAVGDRFKERWSLIRGTSRRNLPGLLARLGQVDLFVHDSLHTEHNVRFELDRAWPRLGARGVIVVDDVDANWGFRSFTETVSARCSSLICEAEPVRPDVRRFNQKGLFGIIMGAPRPAIRQPAEKDAASMGA
jgi:hypothetical protein